MVLPLTLSIGDACAQATDKTTTYPNKPIRIIVGFTPGGGPDITARYVAQKLTEAWKQQVIVDNRPGAGGTVGTNLVANANADGYTLLSVSSAHAVAAAIFVRLPYDTRKDLAGITQTAASKYLLVVAPSLGVKSVKELVALAKAKPGQLNFSSAGVGSGTLSAEQFKTMAGIDVVHVPLFGILNEADVKQRWIPIGLEPRPTTPVEFDRLVATDIDLFTKIARAGNIRAE
jgi:tripartite-type tricarboxylate transporter receptor subunit TctC